MLSRALNLATVTFLIGCLTAVAVHAVENLEAGKTPSQIFSSTCNVCHKSPRGLLKTVPSSSLSGFLRQHYTTSSDMANVLAAFLVSNGAADPRFQAKDQPKQKDGAKDAKQEAATRPAAQQPEPKQQRLPRAGEAPDVMRPDHGPAQAAIDAKQNLKQRAKKGRPEEPKAEEPAKTEPPAETAKGDAKGDDGAKPDGRSDTAKVDAPRESVSEPTPTRADPVPQVTPAPAATAAPPGSATVPVAPLDASPPAPTPQAPPPAVAAAPALPPVPPAGPPAVPISQ